MAPGAVADVLLAQLIRIHFLALESLNNSHYKNNGQIEDTYIDRILWHLLTINTYPVTTITLAGPL